jgi:RNA recognition motif-containing protein
MLGSGASFIGKGTSSDSLTLEPCHGYAPSMETGHRKESVLSKKLYVGNLPFSATEDELRSLFERHGSIASVNVITDRETGRARGFAFVEMDEASAADDAMRALDGSDMGGRSLRVNEAEDKRRGGGGGGGGGYRGGRDRY